jgi:tryptophan synthase alpha chain
LPPDLAGFVQRVRQVARTPLAVGFGISTPEQAAMVSGLADGVIIGSALIDAVAKSGDPVVGASTFMRSIHSAL